MAERTPDDGRALVRSATTPEGGYDGIGIRVTKASAYKKRAVRAAQFLKLGLTEFVYDAIESKIKEVEAKYPPEPTE